MLELVNESFLVVNYDPDTRILHASWKGYQSFDTGTKGCAQILECVKRTGAPSILNDNTETRGLWMDAAEWAARVWFPQLKQAGMRRFAWVYSPAKFSQMSTDTAMASMDPDEYGVRVFADMGGALAWLSQPGDSLLA